MPSDLWVLSAKKGKAVGLCSSLRVYFFTVAVFLPVVTEPLREDPWFLVASLAFPKLKCCLFQEALVSWSPDTSQSHPFPEGSSLISADATHPSSSVAPESYAPLFPACGQKAGRAGVMYMTRAQTQEVPPPCLEDPTSGPSFLALGGAEGAFTSAGIRGSDRTSGILETPLLSWGAALEGWSQECDSRQVSPGGCGIQPSGGPQQWKPPSRAFTRAPDTSAWPDSV